MGVIDFHHLLGMIVVAASLVGLTMMTTTTIGTTSVSIRGTRGQETSLPWTNSNANDSVGRGNGKDGNDNSNDDDDEDDDDDDDYGSCTTSADCAYNGECVKSTDDDDADHRTDPESVGVCRCFAGWMGTTCEVFDLMPVNPQRGGLKLPNHDSSTWGGSVVFNEDDGMYHMFASEILYDCGLYYWTTNSQVIRAVSESPYGPYRKDQVIVPPFAHEPNVIRDPINGKWVLFVTALSGVQPRDCRVNSTTKTMTMHRTIHNGGRHDHTHPRSGNSHKVDMVFDGDNDVVPPKDTYMLWADHPEGPWSDPVMVLNSTIWNTDYWAKYNRTAKCDSNLNGIIRDDGSFVGLWRRCETPSLKTIPHVLTATSWNDPSTYRPHIDAPIFVVAGSGAEDPSNVWTTVTSDMGPGQVAYHAIFHNEEATRCMLGQCGATGRHAYTLVESDNGPVVGPWRYATVNAYTPRITFTDGTILRRVDTRARPHVILDPTSHQPIALSTGLKETDESGYVWTLVQPLRGGPTEHQHKNKLGERTAVER